MVKKVIFVDEDNTGLGAFAAALLRKKAREKGSSLLAGSRGTVVLFPEPVNRKVAQAALAYGINMESHMARPLEDKDFSPDVLMLAMDSMSQKRAFAAHSGFSNIFILKEYVGETGDVRLPLGENEDKYEAVCETVDRLTDLLFEKIENVEV